MNTDAMAAEAIAQGYDRLGHFPRDFSYWELRGLIAKVAHNAAEHAWDEGFNEGAMWNPPHYPTRNPYA